MTQPTWEDLRANGWMVVDHETLLAGTYPTNVATVAFAFQRAEDAAMQVFTVAIDEVPMFQRQLDAAVRIARRELQTLQESSAAQMVFDVVERAKGQA